ncbi:MAG: menaquinone biosynthesis protein [Sediminibacterium sp.]|nr:menaquinone biosynthesis protein [Sediminibacterium sp.]
MQLDKRWRIGVVSYFNTQPLLLGIEKADFISKIELVKDYPANIAQSLIDGKIDIGLVPVAITPLLSSPHIVSEYGIGTRGKVASVAIFSHVPMEQIESIYLDYQSRTSVQLARILLQEFWKKDIQCIKAEEGYIQSIQGTTAGVIIGDRALANLTEFEYIYDLGEAWVAHTGLPFVFAAWMSNQPIPESFQVLFNQANAYGVEHIQDVLAQLPARTHGYDMEQYYTQNIEYILSDEMQQGMNLFLEKVKQLAS